MTRMYKLPETSPRCSTVINPGCELYTAAAAQMLIPLTIATAMGNVSGLMTRRTGLIILRSHREGRVSAVSLGLPTNRACFQKGLRMNTRTAAHCALSSGHARKVGRPVPFAPRG
jgi:hypothetical protein